MKKSIALLAVLALFTSAAFGEITLSGSGRIVFLPFAVRLENSATKSPTAYYFGVENPWDNNGPRIGLGLTGKREEGNMGFDLYFAVEHQNGAFYPEINDSQANVWIKPFGGVFDTLTFTFGKYNIDKLRFKYAGFGSSFHNYVMYVRSTDGQGGLTEEDGTFSRFQSIGFGTHVAYEPIENLWLGIGFGAAGNSRSFRTFFSFKENGFVDVMKNAQAAIAYTIPDILFARVQWLGFKEKEWGETAEASYGWVDSDDNPSTVDVWQQIPATYGYSYTIDSPLNHTWDAGRIQAAFNIKAIKGMDIDLGVSVPLIDEKGYWTDEYKTNKLKTVTEQREISVSAGFDINAARPFRLWGLTTVKIGGYTETDTVGASTVKLAHGTNFAIVLTPMYYIRSDLIVLADLFFDMRVGSETAAGYNDALDTDPTRNPTADAENNYYDLGFGVYIRKNIPGGDVRAGVTCKLPGGEAHADAKPQIFVPVMFNYGF